MTNKKVSKKLTKTPVKMSDGDSGLNFDGIPSFNSTEDDLKQRGIYYITGEIDEGSLLDIHQDIVLKYVTGSKVKELTLVVNSVGGSADETFALVDLLETMKDRFLVKTIGMGTCCSAGAMLLAVGTTGHREIAKNCELMIHEASFHMWIQEKTGGFSLDRAIEILHEKTLDFWMDYSSCKTRKEVETKLLGPKDKWFTPPEAVALGVVDSILGQEKNGKSRRSPRK